MSYGTQRFLLIRSCLNETGRNTSNALVMSYERGSLKYQIGGVEDSQCHQVYFGPVSIHLDHQQPFQNNNFVPEGQNCMLLGDHNCGECM